MALLHVSYLDWKLGNWNKRETESSHFTTKDEIQCNWQRPCRHGTKFAPRSTWFGLWNLNPIGICRWCFSLVLACACRLRCVWHDLCIGQSEYKVTKNGKNGKLLSSIVFNFYHKEFERIGTQVAPPFPVPLAFVTWRIMDLDSLAKPVWGCSIVASTSYGTVLQNAKC